MSFQDLDGVIHVTYGVLVVFWWNCAPYVKHLRSILSCKLDGLTLQMLQMLIKKCNWFQGEALFQTHENLEHLAMMERVLGPLPQHMLKRAECVPIWGFPLLMSSFWCFIEKIWSSMFTIVPVSAAMLRSMSEGVDWTGQKVQPLVKVLNLLWSYLVFRCVRWSISLA